MKPEQLLSLTSFDAPEHQSFAWSSGEGAILLVHGFPGTPAELRPLAQQLHGGGWAVHAPLLPGFGPELVTLAEHGQESWVKAVATALAELRRRHSPVILLGYSLGAALSIQAANSAPPDALILLAPFWRLGSWWTGALVRLLRPFISEFKPFQIMKPDFNQDTVQHGLASFLPGLDFDDPEVQEALLELRIPTKIIANIQQVGAAAFRQTRELTEMPILIIQGRQDEIVLAAHTRKLLARLSGPVHYHEVEAGHDLLAAQQPAWPALLGQTRLFLDGLREQRRQTSI